MRKLNIEKSRVEENGRYRMSIMWMRMWWCDCFWSYYKESCYLFVACALFEWIFSRFSLRTAVRESTKQKLSVERHRLRSGIAWQHLFVSSGNDVKRNSFKSQFSKLIQIPFFNSCYTLCLTRRLHFFAFGVLFLRHGVCSSRKIKILRIFRIRARNMQTLSVWRRRMSVNRAEKSRQEYSLSLIHIWRCRRSTLCRSRWSPYH